jgi:hypothetical protein
MVTPETQGKCTPVVVLLAVAGDMALEVEDRLQRQCWVIEVECSAGTMSRCQRRMVRKRVLSAMGHWQ